MAKVAVLMADGFEEVEALGVVDILRRAEVDVDTVSIKEEQVVISSRNIPVRADKTLTDMDYYDMIVIPGGAGAWTLRDDDRIISLIKKYDHEERYIAAICAGPMALGKAGVITNKKVTSYPGEEIENYLMSYDCVMGIHDLMMHDYGPGRRYLTVHCEVDASIDMMTTHDEIDNIERAMMEKFHILTTIHMDPIDIRDTLTNELRDKVTRIVESIDSSLSIHDFRIVRGPTHTNLVFDVLMKDDKYSKKELNKLITSKVKEMNTTYYCVINFDYSFV